jgi:hypothetical protein
VTGHPDEGTASIEVTANAPCRLYVDGELAFVLEEDAAETVHVDPGGHHVRATQIDSKAGEESTTAVASTRSTAPTEGERSTHKPVGALVWEDTVFATVVSPTEITVAFGESADASDIEMPDGDDSTAPDAAPPSEEQKTEPSGAEETVFPEGTVSEDEEAFDQTATHSDSEWDNFLTQSSSDAEADETSVPSDDEPIWEQAGPDVNEENPERTGNAAGEEEAIVELTAVQECQLSVDGEAVAHLGAGGTQTLRLRPGSHRIRALRSDASSQTTGASGASGPDALGDIVWTKTVFASALDRTEVEIDFTEDDHQT